MSRPASRVTLISRIFSTLALPILASAYVCASAQPSASIEQIVGPSMNWEKCKPAYPQVSKRLGEAGEVQLKVFIEVTGAPSYAEISKSSGFERLDNAALEALACLRFSAARVSGTPTAMWLQFPIKFTLDHSPIGSNYAQRIRSAILPYVVLVEPVEGNPAAEVRVTTRSDGEVVTAELVGSSGYPSWDKSVRIAVLKAGRIPLDVDGKVPPVLFITFRPNP